MICGAVELRRFLSGLRETHRTRVRHAEQKVREVEPVAGVVNANVPRAFCCETMPIARVIPPNDVVAAVRPHAFGVPGVGQSWFAAYWPLDNPAMPPRIVDWRAPVHASWLLPESLRAEMFVAPEKTASSRRDIGEVIPMRFRNCEKRCDQFAVASIVTRLVSVTEEVARIRRRTLGTNGAERLILLLKPSVRAR